MFGAAKRRGKLIRHVMMTLAAVALILKTLIPAGYMVAAPTNDRPFPIMLCTALGMVEVQPGETLPAQGHPEDAADKASAPCVFAGFGLAGPAAEEVALRPSQTAVYAPHRVAIVGGPEPPAAVNGPPLPARGPPRLAI